MPTILAFGGGGGGGMKFISAAPTGSPAQPSGYTDSKYKDGSWAWWNTSNSRLYFYTGGQWRAVNTYQ